MLSAMRLYADNLLCMDLCGWSGTDAIKLLGEEVRDGRYQLLMYLLCHELFFSCWDMQKVHSLKRRREVKEIWGCRHMVEARHGRLDIYRYFRDHECELMPSPPPSPILQGLHPHGIPCQKKTHTKEFKSITRDVSPLS